MTIGSVGLEISKFLASGMKVSTKTEGGKIYTKLFDKEGKLLIDRTKSFEKSIVGNKKVLTKTEERIVNVKNDAGELTDTFGFKYVADRVYDKNGKLIGMREIENKPAHVPYASYENPLEKMPNMKHVTKSVSNGQQVYSYVKFKYLESPVAKSYIKDVVNGVTIRKFASSLIDGMKYKLRELPLGCRKSQYNNSVVRQSHAYLGEVETGGDFYNMGMYVRGNTTMRYNKKGLPLPENIGFKEYEKMENMSLKDMQKLNGDRQYYPYGLNMEV